MACDAHAHPQDLHHLFPDAETERRTLRIACAASSCTKEDFLFIEKMAVSARNDNVAPVFLCFAIHPQLPACLKKENTAPENFGSSLEFLSALVAGSRISAIGECGFDLYSQNFKETEAIQEELFAVHLDIARQYNLPVVLHVRRAMHKIFPYVKILKKLPAVVFHSWSGSPDEAFSLLHKGLPCFFSFGTPLLLNHKNAIQSCAALPFEHLLLETDTPYQPLREKTYSTWQDMHPILEAAATIRKTAGVKLGTEIAELEEIVDRTFFRIFNSAVPYGHI